MIIPFVASLAAPLAEEAAWIGRLSRALAESAQGASLPAALAIFFVGGLLASLTPCVYPMIPIVVAYMGGAESSATAGVSAAARRRRVVLRAVAYVLGMAVVYTVLGVVAASLGQTFGGLTQTFWAYAFVAVVMLVFGLSLLGLFEIRVPSFLMNRLGGGPREGLLGAAFMGATSGLVAAPCAAPIVFPLLAMVGRQGRPVFGALGMFSFSLGLGMLFLALGIFSGLATALPKPGGWMVVMKKIVGALMIVLAGYFLWQGWQRW